MSGAPGNRLSDRPLHVALIGSRGIPNRYGGYETLMEELAGRLVARGWRVTVYCRSHVTPPGLTEHLGARLVTLPTVATKYLDTPVHTFLSALDAGRRGRDASGDGGGFDAALVVNSANALFVPLLRAARIPTALHVDGIEKRRAKWGPAGRAVYAASERLACVVADELVTDAEVIRRHYAERYGAPSVAIAYGVEPRPVAADAPVPPSDWRRGDGADGVQGVDVPAEATSVLTALGLKPRRYFLYVSRFEPENNPHRVVQAYRQTGGDLPLVMVGGAPYADRFIAAFRADAAEDDRILFPGAIYGAGYRQLLSHATAYVHATEVGGTHPALVEAMGYGNCLLVNDAPENREVAGDVAHWFSARRPASLTRAFERVLADEGDAARRRRAAAERARRLYSWPRVVDAYARLFRRLAGRPHDA